MAKQIEELEYWVQRVLPAVYDESLSFYELLNKVVAKLNEVIAQSNEYFAEDITTVVENILTEWDSNGTLDSIINDVLFTSKADKTFVDEQLLLKANTVDVENDLSLKANIDDVNSDLALKADQTQVNADLALKADAAILELKADKSELLYIQAWEYGIDPSLDDNFQLLQDLLLNNKGKVIQLGYGTFKISKPIRIPLGTWLVGMKGQWNDTTGTTLIKTTTDVDVKTGVNAIVIFDYEVEESYHRHGKLMNINLDGLSDLNRTNYGIYALRSAFIELKDVHVRYVKEGFFTNNTWQSYFKGISFRYVDYGFRFVSPNSTSTGTSNVFDKCFVSYCLNTAYHLYGLNYSTMNSCAADFVEGICYLFNTSNGVVMNGCGCEYSSDAFDNWNSSVVVNAMYIMHPKGKTPSTSSAVIKVRRYADTTFNSLRVQTLENPGDTYNMIIDDGGCVVFVASEKPNGGNTYTSYSNSAKMVDIGLNGVVVTPA
jgi:hypothetical protein